MKISLAIALALAALPMPVMAVSIAQLKADTQTLASDKFEGREPGTPGETLTIDYLVKRMKAIGLTPGNKGKWTQDVPLATITAKPAPLTIGGKTRDGAPVTLAYGADQVVWTKRQVAQQVLADSAVVFVGHGINAPELGWNDYAGVDVRGKTVVILVNDPDWQAKTSGREAGLFDGRTQTYYGRYAYKFAEAARQGAAAALVIHQEAPAAWPYGVVTSTWTGPQIDLDSAEKGADRVGIEGWLHHDAATRLLGAAGLDLATLEVAAKRPGFRAIETGVTASTVLDNNISRSASKNVVGMLRGTRRPGEIIVYSAHWDHLGRCTADAAGDDICNGAVDNATGVAGLLGLAEDFARVPRPERSVLFLVVTGEESGLQGSEYYAAHPVFPLGQTVGGVNMDVLNIIGRTDGLQIVGAGKSELEAMVTQLAGAQGRRIVPEDDPEKGRYFRSDQFSLAKRGVPMLYAKIGGEVIGKPPGFGQAAENAYLVKRYHQPSDEYSPDWDWSGAVQDLALFRDLGRDLANSDAWPNWLPGSEFRAIRDASRKDAQ
jgi:Zn-dependent M28 family amino/carboxypeptidase